MRQVLIFLIGSHTFFPIRLAIFRIFLFINTIPQLHSILHLSIDMALKALLIHFRELTKLNLLELNILFNHLFMLIQLRFGTLSGVLKSSWFLIEVFLLGIIILSVYILFGWSVLVHILLNQALLDWISFYYELVWAQIAYNTLRIPAVAQFPWILVRILLGFWLAVNVKVLLSKPLLNLDIGAWIRFLNFSIGDHNAGGTFPIIAHLPAELHRVAFFAIFNQLELLLHLNARVDVFQLVEDFCWNLIFKF